MSWESRFTPEEIAEWEELDLHRQRGFKLYYCKYGIPLNRRHWEYLQEKTEAEGLRRKSQNTSTRNPNEFSTGPRGGFCSNPVEKALGFRRVLDGILRLIAQPSILPHSPSWSRLKHHILQSNLFSANELEPLQQDIMTRLFRLRDAHIGFEFGFDVGGIVAEPPSHNNCHRNREVPLRQAPLNSGLHGHIRRSRLEEDLHPSQLHTPLNCTATYSQRHRVCSVSLCLNGAWKVLTAKYCAEDESFISRRMARQYDLDMEDGEIWLFWRYNGINETFLTPFILLDDLPSDFMIGAKASENILSDDFVDDAAVPSDRSHSEGSSSSSATPRNAWMPKSSVRSATSSRWIPVIGERTSDAQCASDLPNKPRIIDCSTSESTCSTRAKSIHKLHDERNLSSLNPVNFDHFNTEAISETTSEVLIDNVSVFSSLDSSSSQTSLSTVPCPTHEFVAFLLENDELKPLFNKCGKVLEMVTFEREFNVLLKQFSEDILREAESIPVRTVARCFRHSRRKITSGVQQRIYKSDSDKALPDLAVDEYLQLWEPGAGGQLGVLPKLEDDCSLEDEQEHDPTQNLRQAEPFLVQSNAFSDFLTRLRDIVGASGQNTVFSASPAIPNIIENASSLSEKGSDGDKICDGCAKSEDLNITPSSADEEPQDLRPLGHGSNSSGLANGIWSCFIDPPQDVVCIAVIVSFILLELRRPG